MKIINKFCFIFLGFPNGRDEKGRGNPVRAAERRENGQKNDDREEHRVVQPGAVSLLRSTIYLAHRFAAHSKIWP